MKTARTLGSPQAVDRGGHPVWGMGGGDRGGGLPSPDKAIFSVPHPAPEGQRVVIHGGKPCPGVIKQILITRSSQNASAGRGLAPSRSLPREATPGGKPCQRF